MRRAILWLHRALVALLVPRRIRARLGEDLRRTFEVALEDAERSGRVGAFLWREAKSLARTATRARWDGRDRRGRGREGMMRREGRGFWTTGGDDLLHAARCLRRSPGPMAFVVATLALAIGASATIYSAARYTLLSPLPYEDADRIVGIYRTIGEFGFLGAAAESADRWTAPRDVFASAEAYGIVQRTLTGRGEPEQLNAALVSERYFAFLGLEPVVGRSFTPEEVARGDHVVLLGYELWKSRFGSDGDVLDTTVMLDGEPWTVIGVGPENSRPPMGFLDRADVWAPLEADRIGTVVAMLAPGVTLEQANERLGEIVEREHEEGLLQAQFGGAVREPADMVSGNLKSALAVLAAAVGLLLLIACLNAGSLLINRADSRKHETAMRIALGIGRGRLFRQHLVESLLLALAAAGGGIALAYAGVDAIRRLRPEGLESLDRMSLDPPVLAFALGITLATGLLFGLMPALTAASRRGLNVLRAGFHGREDRGATRARWALVVGEIALSFAMLVGSGLLIRTVWELNERDPGFRAEGLAVVRVDLPSWKHGEDERPTLWARLETALESVPGVTGVSLASGVPTKVGVFFGELELEGSELAETRPGEPFFGSSVDPEYFDVVGQPILAGRTFAEEELRTDEKSYIVGESTARELWPDSDAVGERMKLGGDDFGRVVGVVADVVGVGAGSADEQRQLYTPLSDDRLRRWGEAMFAVRSARPVATITGEIRQVIRSTEPDAIVETGSMESYLAGTYATQRFTMLLLVGLASVAGLLACLGLYGVVSQIVGRRTREIGIRMSLGADRASIAQMVLRSGMAATVVGLVLGAVAATAGGRIIASQLYGVEPGDPATLLGAALLLGLATLLATWLPARRAARTDPVRVIAAE